MISVAFKAIFYKSLSERKTTYVQEKKHMHRNDQFLFLLKPCTLKCSPNVSARL